MKNYSFNEEKISMKLFLYNSNITFYTLSDNCPEHPNNFILQVQEVASEVIQG